MIVLEIMKNLRVAIFQLECKIINRPERELGTFGLNCLFSADWDKSRDHNSLRKPFNNDL